MSAQPFEKDVTPASASHLQTDRSATAPASSSASVADAFVIDDEAGICRFVTLALGDLGLSAQSFHNAPDAVAALKRGHPEIVFLDIALEGSDAIEVLRALGSRRFAGVVQLMSGSNTDLLEDVRRVGARHGLIMREPLAKPFRIEAIRQTVTGARLESLPEATIRRRSTLELDLDELLAKGWLELWYQPKFDLRTRGLVGAEGLIRCRHPAHGVVGPDSYLPGAGSASLTALTEHVILTALRDWDEMAGADARLRTAVNASVGSLTSLDIVALVRENRPRRDGWPGLILEVPESEVIDDVGLIHEIATQLRIYNISLAIDDFGEGYSSFARLRELPFGELKLDRGFVDGCSSEPRNAGICRAIVDLAHHFGVSAVAEGLEDAADVELVGNMGCDMGQGYYFARPMTKAKFLALFGELAASGRQWPK
jgi:EAL domain-containing protein (putative c-di-GMP-specific phosphodiesterase class I)/FixJ family two-component response regulator